jgi:mannose-6-phosphate isomerase-like protein (cupin superfamily)
MPIMTAPRRRTFRTIALSLLALALALGWSSRELAFARMKADLVKSGTINLDALKMTVDSPGGKPVGHAGLYFSGDTPGSKKFVTGRYIIDPGKSPHAPHTHVEEEVMIVESGHGEIFCDGKTTAVGPGSAMYTAPNAPHGIVNTGDSHLVFSFVKWASDSGK